jgi:hypothetical protein
MTGSEVIVKISDISEHMEVIGVDGRYVGTVDHLDGVRIKLAKSDPTAGGEHHYIHLDVVEKVQDDKVVLDRTAAQARDEWDVKEIGQTG